MINVTQPFLPPFEEYTDLIKGIWERNWLTNNGPLVNELELKLKKYLAFDHLLYVSNGTIALQIAIKALGLKGEIITTPFSYVATTSSIIWEGCKPVFVDIDASTLNIDPAKIEEAISPRTSAILATHVFGNPCAIEAIQTIADRHKLRVIYDGAHAFGTLYRGRSLFDYGDISTTSFHATKLFHTIEGGALFTKEHELLEKMAWLRNFGHHGPEDFKEVGINGKNSEFHAAMGLVNLRYISEILEKRKRLHEWYDEGLDGLRVRKQSILPNCKYNYSYYPIVFQTEGQLLKALEELNTNEVYPRRYFWPSLNTISYTKGIYKMPVSEDISRRILCLPLFQAMTEEEVGLVCRLLMRAEKN